MISKRREIQKEIKRKGIHILSTIVPVFYYYNTKELLIILVGIGTLMMILIDWLKIYDNFISKLYKKYLFDVLRKEEKDFKKNWITGGTYYAVGIFLSVLLFDKQTASLSVLILIWSDTIAAIVGKVFGKYQIFKYKTIEGSIAFLITGIIILMILQNIYPDYNYYNAGFITVFVVTFIELYNYKIDDNLLLPVTSGAIFFLINKFF